MLIQVVAILVAYYLGRSGMDFNDVLTILDKLTGQNNEDR